MPNTKSLLYADDLLNYLKFLDLRTASRIRRLLFECGADAEQSRAWSHLDHLPDDADVNVTDPAFQHYEMACAQRRVIETISQYLDELVEDAALDRGPDGKTLAVGS
jgi:hypothetical protein